MPRLLTSSLIYSLFLPVLLSWGSSLFGNSGPELKIVFIAYENPDQLVEEVAPVIEYLERELQISVKDFVATDYSGVVEALRNQTADVGFMGPLQYIMAHQQTGAVPLLGEIYNGKSTYVSRIFVRKDSGFNKLEDLRGKNIAFVDPISSSGFMYPLDIFRQAGLATGRPEDYFGKIYFAGGDEQAIRAVYNRFVDAAGAGQFAYHLLRPEERDSVDLLAESRPIPSHCLVARKGLEVTIINRLKKALLALNKEGPNHHLLSYLYGVDGYIEVTHDNYAGVAEIARAYGFIK